ncbi:MAG TPA: DNA repair protein RadC [Puia sp.]
MQPTLHLPPIKNPQWLGELPQLQPLKPQLQPLKSLKHPSQKPLPQPPKNGINNWLSADRPREKLLYKGSQALSDAELLAILLRTGRYKANAVELARELLKAVDNNLRELGKYPVKKLMKIKGIGLAKAITIAAALELARRREASFYLKKDLIRDSKSVASYFRSLLTDYSHEVFGILYLNQAGHVKQFEIISHGGLTSTIADPRIIFRKTLEIEAVSIILCHNHPSGNPQPSSADITLTAKLHAGAKILDIKLLDHIIIGNNDYFSFADNGLLIPTPTP